MRTTSVKSSRHMVSPWWAGRQPLYETLVLLVGEIASCRCWSCYNLEHVIGSNSAVRNSKNAYLTTRDVLLQGKPSTKSAETENLRVPPRLMMTRLLTRLMMR